MPGDATFPGLRWSRRAPPGLYERLAEASPQLDVRMDVAAFVGLAERGPVGTAVAVESWDEFQLRFGRPGGGRLLPEAVRLFFVNAGRRCVVVRAAAASAARPASWRLGDLRVASSTDDYDSPARAEPLVVRAASVGSWGDRLRFALTVERRALALAKSSRRSSACDELRLPTGDAWLVSNALVRLHVAGGETRVRFVREVGADAGGVVAELEPSPLGPAVVVGLEVATLRLEVAVDGIVQRWSGLGFHVDHERSFADALSASVDDATAPALAPDEGPRDLLLAVAARGDDDARPIVPSSRAWLGAELRAELTDLAEQGADAAAETYRHHLFDAAYDEIDPAAAALLGIETPTLDALDAYTDRNPTRPIALVHMPDLAQTGERPLDARRSTRLRGEPLRFDLCAGALDAAEAPTGDYPHLQLWEGTDYTEVREGQQLLARWCDERDRRAIAVLDLPPGLHPGDVVGWRKALAQWPGRSALYAPYVRVPRGGEPEAELVTVPPGGAVCGIVARVERERGVHSAPANALVEGIVALHDEPLPPAFFLHEERVNAMRPTERGLSLLGSRTTSDDAAWTHVSVRRLIDFLCRQLAVDAQFAVFEPNDADLWARLRLMVERRLRALYARGAFAGASAAESYFVHCDESTTPSIETDLGRVVATVGVAPAVPAEFIVFSLTLLEDGAIRTEEERRG